MSQIAQRAPDSRAAARPLGLSGLVQKDPTCFKAGSRIELVYKCLLTSAGNHRVRSSADLGCTVVNMLVIPSFISPYHQSDDIRSQGGRENPEPLSVEEDNGVDESQ